MAKKKPETPATPSKMGMVREAVGELGSDAKPKDIAAYIRAKHGADIPATMISAYKSNILRGEGSTGGTRRKANGADVGLAELAAVKELLDRIGAKQLGELVKVLA